MGAPTVFFDIGETLREPRLSPAPDLRVDPDLPPAESNEHDHKNSDREINRQ